MAYLVGQDRWIKWDPLTQIEPITSADTILRRGCVGRYIGRLGDS